MSVTSSLSASGHPHRCPVLSWGVSVPVEAYLGATKFASFPIDLSTELHAVAHVERARPAPIIEMPGLPELPEFVLYPLPDQVADKVCAMYERHGSHQQPSTRYRDLVDLLLITMNCSFDAAMTVSALASESRRRQLVLPITMSSPDDQWESGYRAMARSTTAIDVRSLSAALSIVGACLNPLLASDITEGSWNPTQRCWTVPEIGSPPSVG